MINALLAVCFLGLASLTLRSFSEEADAKALALPMACLVSWYMYNVGCLTGDSFPPPEIVILLESISVYSIAALGYQLWAGGYYDYA